MPSCQGPCVRYTAVFSGKPAVDTPLQGRVAGSEDFPDFVLEQQAWLQQRQAKPELLAVTATSARVVLEFVFCLQQREESIDLPVAMAGDLVPGGVSAIRVYRCTWPLTGEHLLRSPLLAPGVNPEEPAVIEAYLAGIAKPDEGEWE